MERERNIVIVGGGVIGSTTAYYLTRHSSYDPFLHTITLLEAGPEIAIGASGKAGGLLGLWAYPACLVPLSYKLHEELAAEHNGAQKWGYRRLACGSIEAVVSEEHADNVKRSIGEGKAWEKLPKHDNVAKELLASAGSSLPDDLDYINRDLVKSWHEMGGPGTTETSQVHPYHFTTSIAKLAQNSGVAIETNCQVISLKTGSQGVEGLEYINRLDNSQNELKDVTDIIITAGPWTSVLLPRSKVEGLRAHSVVYEADVSPYAVFTNILLPTNFVPDHRAKMGQKRKHKGIVDPEIYARPFGEVYACGEPDKDVPLPPTVDQVQVDEAQCDDMISYIGTVSPILSTAPIKAKQACYLPRHMRFGQEVGPLIGKTTISGLFVAAGHTCWGIQNGPGTGKLMAEYVFDGKASSADISNLDPRKFKV